MKTGWYILLLVIIAASIMVSGCQSGQIAHSEPIIEAEEHHGGGCDLPAIYKDINEGYNQLTGLSQSEMERLEAIR